MRIESFNTIFSDVIRDYHLHDDVDYPINNPYKEGSLEYLLYLKNWIDTVQWHLEDIIRDPNIDPVAALAIKRRIDKSNQDRTDMVEYVDSYFLNKFKDVKVCDCARVNTETPAWAVDRLSILALKIYHMSAEAARSDVSAKHIEECKRKANVLAQQQIDLSTSIEELLEDLASGKKYMKIYKQMKMYNDPELNPVLYASK